MLLTYPHVLTLEEVRNITEISDWIQDIHVDCRWHTFLIKKPELKFDLAYDFFFKLGSDAVLFKLTWGGSVL